MRVSSLAIMVGSGLFLIVLVLTSSYAWFVHSAFESIDGNMGEVNVGFGGHIEVDEEGIAGFEVSNLSTIDIYMRLGWTPIYRDKTGNEVTADVSDIKVIETWLADTSINNSPLDGMKPVASNIISQNNYIKNMITLEDQNDKYFVIPAGVGVSGYVKLNTVNNPDTNERLYIVFVTEALQATRKAVAEATPYGWDEDKVEDQARWIVALERGDGQ